MSYISHPAASPRWKNLVGLCAAILWLVAPGSILVGQTTNGAPANPPASATPAGEETFGRYLAEHEDDLAPFFDKNGDELASQAAPLILKLLGKIMLFTLLTCLMLDVALIRWFSLRFAPAFSKWWRALIYATGRLVLSVLFYALLGLAVVFVPGLGHEVIVAALLFLVFLIIELAVQAGWVRFLYSTPVPDAILCYLGIFVAHIFTGVVISAPILAGHAAALVTAYVDTDITPKLQAAAAAEKKDLATTTATLDGLKAQIDDAQKKIDENTGEQQQLQQQIDQEKNSDGYLFSRIVKLRAQGNLEAARDQITDLLNKFPNRPLSDAMKTQLAGIDSDLAAQAAQKQQAQAQAAQADAQARADLLARASRGEVTLSEMRLTLVGKKPADITALFGPPAATASDRWGYSQRMIINPMTQEKFGLTIYFSDGTVQGVDYYYGTGGGGTQ